MNMPISCVDDVKKFLQTFGFVLPDGSNNLSYKKIYKNHNDYVITVDVDAKNYKKSRICYGDKINADRGTTECLHQNETFVILECVDRLLEKGYAPEDIMLEKSYPAGHKEQGQFLDILVFKSGSPYYMIECKTVGQEYNNELTNMKRDGGQLLTYFTNDRGVKKLILYTSCLDDGKIVYESSTIDSSTFIGSSKKDIFNEWNKKFDKSGIFEAKKPYSESSEGIKRGQLKALSEQTSIFNGFARILRKNAVSDYTNAFNKLFNLLLCKIVDEDRASDDDNYEMIFQWKKEETDYEVFDKISNLYEIGIKNYLNISVSDYSTESIEKDLDNITDDSIKKKLKEKFNTIRFEKNNEFAFIEVFNKETFKQNALIVREIMLLLQGVRVKYSDKQQFLGDFFERLLNIGIKQSEGQFFTPIPIANFIVNSIPFERLIGEKIEKSDDGNFLPYMIDYACGAGHFVTEYMHRIDKIINDKKFKDKLKGKLQKSNYEAWKIDYKWADRFVYGIEKDYRLTKTSKIACFLNGDGDARIITGNGLDTFDSDTYKNTILHNSAETYSRDNKKFDVVIANPPYSVQDFKDTLAHNNESYGNKAFELFDSLGKDSDDIECLFIERTKQLLKEDGYAGIVISNTFLTNPGIHQKARELCIKNFKIRAIVELGAGAFMATNTNTVILFMQKRKDDELSKVEAIVSRMLENGKDFSYSGDLNIVSQFVEENYNISFNDYSSLLKGKLSAGFMETELFNDYYSDVVEKIEKELRKKNLTATKRNELEKTLQLYVEDKAKIPLCDLIELEITKLKIYLLNYGFNTIVVTAGESKDDRKEFLGYSFSNRKGNEGIKELTDVEIKELDSYSNRGKISSRLYNPSNLLDANKVNFYIYKNFEGSMPTDFLEELKLRDFDKNISYYKANELFSYSDKIFDYKMRLKSKKKIKLESKYPFVRLEDVTSYISAGIVYNQKNISTVSTNNCLLTADNVTLDGKLNISKVIYLKSNIKLDSDKKLNKGDTFICLSSGSLTHIGKVAYVEDDLPYYAGGFMGIIRSNEKVNNKYLFNILSSVTTKECLENLSTGNNINNLSSSLNKLKIPLPPKDIQDVIDGSIDMLNKESLLKDSKIQELNKQICDIVLSASGEQVFLKKISALNPSKEELKEYGGDLMVSFIDMSSVSSEGYIERKIDKPLSSLRKGGFTYFKENDIIIAKITPCMENGKCAIAEKLTNGIGLGSTEFNVIRCDSTKILPKFLFLSLNTKEVREAAQRVMTGAIGHKRVPASFYEKLAVTVPTIEVQKRLIKQIVPIEEEIEKLKKEVGLIPQQKQAVLDRYLK